MTEAPDSQLVGQTLGGDPAAFTALVHRHQQRLLRYAARMLGEMEEAEEAVQDSFVRAHRSLARCADPEKFGAWLFSILVNRCRTRGVANRRRAVRFVHPEVLPEPGVPHPENNAAWRDEIQRALATLPADQREAFLLKHVEDLEYDTMSKTTGASIPALKMRVKRACDRLRAELTEVANAS